MKNTTDNRVRPYGTAYTNQNTPSIFFSFGHVKTKVTLTPEEEKEIQELLSNYGKYKNNQTK